MTICNEPITLLALIDKVITPKRDFDYVVRRNYIEEFPFTEDSDTIYSEVFAISHNNGVHIVSLDGDMYSLNTKIIAYEEWTNETHIADICIGNYVIEVQHSSMDLDTFNERTVFYTELGYKLIWIF